MDVPELRRCMVEQDHVPAVAQMDAEARELGVTGTPTIFVNGEPVVRSYRSQTSSPPSRRRSRSRTAARRVAQLGDDLDLGDAPEPVPHSPPSPCRQRRQTRNGQLQELPLRERSRPAQGTSPTAPRIRVGATLVVARPRSPSRSASIAGPRVAHAPPIWWLTAHPAESGLLRQAPRSALGPPRPFG